MEKATTFDVAVVGAGLSGSILGAILARQGHTVLLLDAKEHPKFALGEATTPQTGLMMRAIAARYDVPEVGACSTFDGMHQYVTSHGGIKSNFGFVYQQPGLPQNPQQVTQNIIPHLLVGYDSHWYRQDIDAYLLNIAIRYGAVARQNTRIEDITIDEEQVAIRTDRGETYSARYIVDSSGFKSVLANKFQLRESPCRFETHSRSLFNHFVGVKPYDNFGATEAWGVPQPWNAGTMHHLFPGGWMWVIPFNNNPESNSLLCSVGVSLDPRVFPKTDLTPQQEFNSILDRFPDVAQQFVNAKPVREWVSTDRLQYSSSRSVGDRFCLTAQAAGTIDALFSRGMSNTMDGLYLLADLLLEALGDGDFSAERFAPLEKLQQRQLDYNDQLVRCSYTAFSDFTLWNAWYRVWSYGGLMNVFRIKKIYDQYQETGDKAVLDTLKNPLHVGSVCPGFKEFEDIFNASTAAVKAFENGTLTAAAAADVILALFDHPDFVPPIFHMSEASRHYNSTFDADEIAKLFKWSETAKPELRELCF